MCIEINLVLFVGILHEDCQTFLTAQGIIADCIWGYHLQVHNLVSLLFHALVNKRSLGFNIFFKSNWNLKWRAIQCNVNMIKWLKKPWNRNLDCKLHTEIGAHNMFDTMWYRRMQWLWGVDYDRHVKDTLELFCEMQHSTSSPLAVSRVHQFWN